MFRIIIVTFFLFIGLGASAAELLQRPVARPAVTIGDLPIPTSLEGQSPTTCLAIAIYHEARGESVFGQRAVASVILQRSEVIGRWGDDACSVIVPVQFAFLEADRSFAPIRDEQSWSRALATAKHVLATGPLPHLKKADHYHAESAKPSWRHAMVPVRQIGDHIFYRDPTSRS